MKNCDFIHSQGLKVIVLYIAWLISVAEAVADINRAVSEGDDTDTLGALQCPAAGLRAVLSECAHIYHSQLSQLQSTQTEQGNYHTGVWKI